MNILLQCIIYKPVVVNHHITITNINLLLQLLTIKGRQMLSNFILRSTFKMTNLTTIASPNIKQNINLNQYLSSSLSPNTLSSGLLSKNKYAFSKYKLPLSTDIDTANLLGYINASDSPFLLFRQKMSEFSFTSMYHGMYDFSRQLLFTIANDYHLGIPMAIIIISASIRLIFLYPTVIGQLNGLKMKQMQPQTQRYKEKLKLGRQTSNSALVKQAQIQYRKARSAHGVSMFIPMLNMLQIPFLITWFLQLRDLANLGELYPQLYHSSFLWITDLTTMDYFLPVIAAVLTSLSIHYSPNMKKGAISNAFIAKYRHIMPLLPFFSLLFTIWFPSTLNVYWGTIALAQLSISLMLNYEPLVIKLGYKPKQTLTILIPDTKKIKAVFVDQKSINIQTISTTKLKEEQGQSSQKQQVALTSKKISKKEYTPPKFKARK